MQLLFVLPFLINLALIYSASNMCNSIDSDLFADYATPISSWIFYVMATAFAPPAIEVITLLPQPLYAVCGGGLLTSLGLLGSTFSAGWFHLITFGCLASFGICLSFIVSCMCLASVFLRRNRCIPLALLVASTFVVATQHRLMTLALHSLGRLAFLVLSSVVFIACVLPAFLFVYVKKRDQVECSCFYQENQFFVKKDNAAKCFESELMCNVPSGSSFPEGRLQSILTMLVWLGWGSGVVTTWFSFVLSPHSHSTWLMSGWHNESDIIIIQLLISILVCLIKIITNVSAIFHSVPNDRCVTANNYMQLGLLGTAGLTYCMFPGSMNAIHNQMLFSLTFALHFVDLDGQDIKDVVPGQNSKQSPPDTIPCMQARVLRTTLEGTSLVCYIFSFFVISSCLMCIGLPVANTLGFVVKLVQPSIIFSTHGLMVASAICIAMSLSQPDLLRKRHKHPSESIRNSYITRFGV